MKFGVVVFPGSNCDHDMEHVLQNVLGGEVVMLWHKDEDLSAFTTEDCLVMVIIYVVGLSPNFRH